MNHWFNEKTKKKKNPTYLTFLVASHPVKAMKLDIIENSWQILATQTLLLSGFASFRNIFKTIIISPQITKSKMMKRKQSAPSVKVKIKIKIKKGHL